MTASESFGATAGMRYRVTFDDRSHAETAFEKLGNFIQATSLARGIVLNGRMIEFDFDTPADYLVARDFIEMYLDTRTHDHMECFKKPIDQGYLDRWVFEARQFLQDAEIKHQVIEEDAAVRFKFQSTGALSMFSNFIDTGYFNRRAKVVHAIEGPPPSSFPY